MLELDFSVFPELRTERLHLRELTQADAPALHAMRSDPRVMQHIGRPLSTTLADSELLIEQIAQGRKDNTGITWAITLNTDPTVIGTIGYYRLKPEHHRGEIGYLLAADHWRKGYMGEALEAAIDAGFQRFRFHTIEAITDPLNTASNALLARHGFVREGSFKENYLWNGVFHDSAVWSRMSPLPATV